MAQADSSGSQYEDAPPTATGDKPSQRDPIANSSNNGGGSQVPSTSPSAGGGNSDAESSQVNESPSAGGAKSGSGGTGQGSPDKGSTKLDAKAAGDQDQAGTPATQPAKNASASTDDDGSSPLVPILLAILALAAISVGVVVTRQRRQRGSTGSPVSPKAN